MPAFVEAWDTNPYRTQLGVTQIQRQNQLQNQMIRQLDQQRAIQNLREQQMSRQLHRQVQTLKDRQSEMAVRQELQRGRVGAVIGGPAQPLPAVDEAKMRPAVQKQEAKKQTGNGPQGDLANGVGDEGKAEVKTDSAGGTTKARP
jgi:hypothetical protein